MTALILHFESKDALVAYATGQLLDGRKPAPVQGGRVQPWVQAFADAVVERYAVGTIGTYPGHHPTIDRALDIFVDRSTGDALAEWAIGQYDRFALRYHMWWWRRWQNGQWWPVEDRGSPTQNHEDHGHFGFEADGPAAPPPEEDDMTDAERAQLKEVHDLVRDLHAYMSETKGGRVDTIEEAIAGVANDTKYLAGNTNAQIVAFFAAFDPQYPARKDIDIGRQRLVELLKSLDKGGRK